MTDTEAAPAKVNLYLHVTGRAPGGYHTLDSLAVFGPAFDVLHFAPAETLTLDVTGPFAAGLASPSGPGDNLVLRAARALAAEAGVAAGAALVLDKRLPIASGIGGGSADAAAALRLLARAWGVRPAPGDLARIAAGLGADVPVCLDSRPARMTGIGEVLTAVPDPAPVGLLLVNAGPPVATADVFRRREGAFSPAAVVQANLLQTIAATRNDLEPFAIAACPVIADVLAALRQLPGCRAARMSGSGGTCFGVFASPGAAAAAACTLPIGWWRCGGGLWPFTDAA